VLTGLLDTVTVRYDSLTWPFRHSDLYKKVKRRVKKQGQSKYGELFYTVLKGSSAPAANKRRNLK
jgi:hypothetical protein